jgi:transcriptional regulator with XRE-family HTH domain
MEQTLGNLLLTLRRARGLTQIQLAEKLTGVVGMQQPTISDLERNEYHPSAGQLEHVLRQLEATPQDRASAYRLAAKQVAR